MPYYVVCYDYMMSGSVVVEAECEDAAVEAFLANPNTTDAEYLKRSLEVSEIYELDEKGEISVGVESELVDMNPRHSGVVKEENSYAQV